MKMKLRDFKPTPPTTDQLKSWVAEAEALNQAPALSDSIIPSVLLERIEGHVIGEFERQLREGGFYGKSVSARERYDQWVALDKRGDTPYVECVAKRALEDYSIHYHARRVGLGLVNMIYNDPDIVTPDAFRTSFARTHRSTDVAEYWTPERVDAIIAVVVRMVNVAPLHNFYSNPSQVVLKMWDCEMYLNKVELVMQCIKHGNNGNGEFTMLVKPDALYEVLRDIVASPYCRHEIQGRLAGDGKDWWLKNYITRNRELSDEERADLLEMLND